ncbi:hypothetical protein, partial [Acidithiobacillus ferriphilus]|uniref:hypothetical protein n=1 Tax=Acidithiobacillus ferriphilus TaxID=1689834 RepID=UPI001C07E1BD
QKIVHLAIFKLSQCGSPGAAAVVVGKRLLPCRGQGAVFPLINNLAGPGRLFTPLELFVLLCGALFGICCEGD